MSDLSFNQEKLFHFLLNEIIDIQARQSVLELALNSFLTQQNPQLSELLNELFEKHLSTFREKSVEILSARLKGQSDDFDDYLDGLINSD